MSKEFKYFKIKKIEVPGKFVMSPVELKEFIDFMVKRIYFITNIESPTGAHCHKVEEELFILQSGTCTAVIDRGEGMEEIKMQGPTDAVYVPAYVWHHFKDFSADGILLAISSTNYNSDRSDYIENYDEFQSVSKQNK